MSLGYLVKKPKASVAIGYAKLNNPTSQSNGSLMRATPMAVFMSRASEEERFNAVVKDVSMTHPNQVVQQAVYLYS